jgi:acyl carrier protein
MIQMQREMPDTSSPELILSSVIATIESIVQDWDLEHPVNADTRLVADLGFESIDLIQMVAALEQDFSRPNFSFAELLIVDGRYVDDLTVGQIAKALADRV